MLFYKCSKYALVIFANLISLFLIHEKMDWNRLLKFCLAGHQPKAVRLHRGRALLCLLPPLSRLFLVRRQSLAQANPETQQVL